MSLHHMLFAYYSSLISSSFVCIFSSDIITIHPFPLSILSLKIFIFCAFEFLTRKFSHLVGQAKSKILIVEKISANSLIEKI